MSKKTLSRTPKKATVETEQEYPSILDHFGLTDNKPTVRETVVQPDDRDDRIAELTKRLDDLQRANVALMSQAPVETKPSAAPKDLDLSGLPDPVAEPDKYTSELNKRINANMSERMSYVSQQLTLASEQERKYNELWSDFSARHADVAKDEERVKIAAQSAMEKAKSRGIDVQKYATSGREQFFGDILKEHERLFGKVAEVSDEDDTSEDTSDTSDDGRSMSIFGGLESGSSMPKGKGSPREMGDMVKDIQDIQRRTGFY